MISFHNISSIAKYERKTLFRSWFFRIFSILSLLVLFMMNLGMVSDAGNASWIFRAVPTAIPYFNLLILNVAQAIIAVFLASDFLKRDKKLDTTEVIYMRSMTNGEYVIGKTLGNIQVFMILNIAILLVALVFNLTLSNTRVPWVSYPVYLLLISIPTLVYIMGLSFLLMSLIRNQAVTFVIILGYIGITLFMIQGAYYYVFDYMAFNIPMLQSDIVGFGNLATILGHRGIYFCLGAGFIFLTIFLLKRLPQSESMTWLSVVFSVLFIGAGIYLAFNHINRFVRNDHLRASALELNNRYAALPVADVSRHSLILRHQGETIGADALLVAVNNNDVAMDSLVFSLNPGLEISALKMDGREAAYDRKLQLAVVDLEEPLAPGDSVKMEVSYAGTIDEAFCFLDISKEKQQQKFGEFVINVDKRYAFVTPGYVLLTREANWYPETGVTYTSRYFGWNRLWFTDFTLRVETDTVLKALSQGDLLVEAPGKYLFTNKQPLTQISLVIGDYVNRKIAAGGVEFGIWHLRGHDTFSQALPEITDTIPALIEEQFRDFQRTFNLEYPFSKLSLVEVPAQFKPYDRTWTLQQETVQPEQILLQEKGYLLNDLDVKSQIKRQKKWNEREGRSLTDKEYQITALLNILGNFTREGGRPVFRRTAGQVFQAQESGNPYYVFPQFYYFSNHIRSDRWPVTNLILEAYLKSQSNNMAPMWMRNISGLSEDEMANIALQDHSFEEMLKDKEQEYLIDNLMKLKGDALFTMIQAKVGEAQFAGFLRDQLRENRFRVIHFDSLDQALRKDFDVTIAPYMDNWFKDKRLPGFLISPINAVNTKSEDQIRTMISFSASNTSEVDGVVRLTFRLGGFGGGRSRMMMRGGSNPDDNINKLLSLKAGETKKVSYLFDSEPRGLTINTLTSKNIPQTLEQFFRKVEEDLKAAPVEGEEVTDIPVSLLQPNEILVDNEDPGFSFTVSDRKSLLHRLIVRENETPLKYSGLNNWRPPLAWTNTTNSAFYGDYVRSAHYIKSGPGDQRVTWILPVTESGYYDLFAYVNPGVGRGRGYGPGMGRGGSDEKGEYHFYISHDDGETEQTLQINSAETGWNSLGSYYFSAENAKVELSNQSALRMVIADAIKLVKN